jgi:RNase P subunit RPR2
MRQQLMAAGVGTAPEVEQLFCQHCSTMLLPGINCTVRLVTRISRKSRSNINIEPVNDLQTPTSRPAKFKFAPSASASKRLSAAAALRGAINQLVYKCRACGFAATALKGTPRAWKVTQAVRRQLQAQSTASKKRKLQRQLGHTPSQTTPKVQTSGTSAAKTPNLAAPLFQFQHTPSVIKPGPVSLTPKTASASVVPAGTAADTQSSSSTTATPKPGSISLDQRAKELKKAAKRAAQSMEPSTTPSHSVPSKSDAASSVSTPTATASSAASPPAPSTPFSFQSVASSSSASRFSFVSAAADAKKLKR